MIGSGFIDWTNFLLSTITSSSIVSGSSIWMTLIAVKCALTSPSKSGPGVAPALVSVS